ncbi:MAG: hypothetical protein JO064_06900 [Actinobacteria bacterium]|nr:hypothetical protein [Actinomycetota bacterium]
MLRGIVLAALAATAGLALSACGGSGRATYTINGTTTPLPPGVVSTQRASTMLANTPMSRAVLSNRFKAPAGFTVESMNPVVPTQGYGYGSVGAVVMSSTSVEYDVTFSPLTIPCQSSACTSVTRTLSVGTANPTNAQAIFSPEIGQSAECGYDPDAHQVGCDTIVNGEYISVRGDAAAVSTVDAVAVLRAASAYVAGLKP